MPEANEDQQLAGIRRRYDELGKMIAVLRAQLELAEYYQEQYDEIGEFLMTIDSIPGEVISSEVE